MAGFGGAVKLTGESEYRKALKAISQDLRELSAETKLVSAQYASNSKSIEALTAKQTALNKQYEAQSSKVKILKDQYASMGAEYDKNKAKHQALVDTYKAESDKLAQIGKECGTTSAEYKLQAGYVSELSSELTKSSKNMELNETQLSKMRTELTNATTEMTKTENELRSLDSELKNTSDSSEDLGKEVKDAGDQAKKAADGGFTVFKGILANLGASAIKSALSGLKKLGSEIVNVGKQAFNAYSEFEQLTGGVETLFGESAEQVKKYAENAYKTAGMSANTYMQTVTSFSATLLQGLNGDTAKAAQVADKAITDMADNANKMGTSLEMIQNAYQGFAKQNFTMLDNLKLGYGGTKTEMLRLVKDAGVVEQSVKSINEVSFDKIIDAIHIVQTNMGITGTTAEEAEDTIEGSTLSMRAAWDNLLVAVASDNSNMTKAVKNFTQSAETFFKNAAPRVKQIVEGIFTAGKKLAKKYMPEVYNTVMPVLEKLSKALKDVATFITKNFDKIAPVVMTAVAAFTAFNAAMAISKTVTAVTTALSGLSAGVSLATQAQAVYNAVLSSNPIMAVVTAVAALTAAVILLASKESEAEIAHREQMEALQEQRDEIQSNIDSWNSLKDAQEQNMSAGMSEVSHLQSLKKELSEITDANGKVKDGYEKRADFIRSQLAEALDIEINMTDGIIENYTGIMNAIDLLIDKKKAEIILNSQEALYSEAILNRTEAVRTLSAVEEDRNNRIEEMTELQNQFDAAQKDWLENQGGVLGAYSSEMEEIADLMDAKQAELDQVEANYTKQLDLVNEYAYNIGVYEKNMQLAHEGNYNDMITANWEYARSYQDTSDAQKKMLEDQLEAEKYNYNRLRILKKESGSDLYDQQLLDSEQRIKQLEEEMEQYVSTTQKGNDEVKIVWSDSLDDQLSAITGYNVEFKDAGGGLVQMYVDGIATGEAKSKSEMADIVTATINEISKQETNGKKAGENLIEGVNKGVGALSKQQSVFTTVKNFGTKVIANLKASLKEQSPSKATKEMGKFLVEGLPLGIKENERSALKEVASFGKNVIDAFNSELTDKANLTNLAEDFSSEVKDIIPAIKIPSIELDGVDYKNGSSLGSGALNYQSMINAFKEALGDMTVELDDQKVGKFVTKTVSNAIYT